MLRFRRVHGPLPKCLGCSLYCRSHSDVLHANIHAPPPQLHRVPSLLQWQGCAFSPVDIVQHRNHHTQEILINMKSNSSMLMSQQLRKAPPIVRKWLHCGLLRVLPGSNYHTQVLHDNTPPHKHLLMSPRLHPMPQFLKKLLGSAVCPHKVYLCRTSSVVAFQDVGSQAEGSCSTRNSRDIAAQMPGTDHSGMATAQTPINESHAVSLRSHQNSVIDECKDAIVLEESVEALEELLMQLEMTVSDGDPRIAALCLRLAQLCVSKDKDPEKILQYGLRALDILGSSKVSLECATCLEVIGCAYHKKEDFEKAVAHLEQAAFILEKLKSTVKQEDMGSLQYAVQALLGQANMSLGREEEALLNFQDALAINEKVLEPDDPILGKSYQQVAEAFMQVQDLEEALALCLKALSIYMESYGSSSLQVAELRKLLSAIYYDLDEFEKVLSEHQLTRPIFVALGKSEEVASLDLASGEAFLCLDKYIEAISKLEVVIRETTHENHCHGQALVLLAKAHAALKEDKKGTMYCNKALDVLRNKESSVMVGASLVELGLVLRQLSQIEESLSVLKMSLGMYENFPKEKTAIAFIEGQIGLLYLGSERASDALPYLEACVAKNEGIFGADSKELLDVYNQLGVAYIQLGKHDEALVKFEAAKAIAEENDMAKDPATITLYNNLAHVYSGLGRIGDAILCQKLLVKTIKKTGLETDVSLEEAEQKLEDLLQEAVKCQDIIEQQDSDSEQDYVT